MSSHESDITSEEAVGARSEAAGEVPSADEAETSGEDALRRLRQNSASVVAIPVHRGDTAPRLSPMQVTLCIFASWAMLATVDLFGQPAEKLAQLIVSVLVVLTLSAVHELGHVFAGGMVGLRLVSCSVGPIALVRRGGRYALDENPHWIRFAGCVEHDIPRGTATRRHLTISAIGGPIANFLFAGAIFACGPSGIFVQSVALWSAIFGLINTIPIRLNGQTSDGGIVWRLWSNRPDDIAWRNDLLAERRTRAR